MKTIVSVLAAISVGPAPDVAPADARPAPVVVELFTSQSCSSCVAAAEYFADLADRDDVVALGWHVDYWNALQTSRGRWVDPYSDAAYTERQRRYNQNLRATNGVYTPQIVVGGRTEAIGSSRSKVDSLIDDERDAANSARIASMQRNADGDISFSVIGAGEVFVVYFDPVSVTSVHGGENAGRRFDDRNIVTDSISLGDASRNTFSTKAPGADEGCAVLVQAPDQGRILAARYCSDG